MRRPWWRFELCAQARVRVTFSLRLPLSTFHLRFATAHRFAFTDDTPPHTAHPHLSPFAIHAHTRTRTQLDIRTRNLVDLAGVSDYVLSNEIVSMAIAMVAEDRAVNAVLRELLSEEGNETYLKDCRLYCGVGEEVSFFEVMRRALLRRQVAIGYRTAGGALHLNPASKNETRAWTAGDVVIVIAED